ncbi:MAG: phosphopantothenoylcysteine decarboxylase [Candidatus Omnitrophica bacterium]|nr:phosphopantothenoylcysteine decarboxylase [Candidatus Omnitrophota bacterium]
MKFLIVYGPTQEPIDPVRFISNYSTGVMGRFLVEAAKKRGHAVTAVECPARVRTARDLLRLLRNLVPKHDVFVMAAAVCDARPAKVASKKIKKEGFTRLALVRNPDILAGLARTKKKNQIFVGFALESEKVADRGMKKLKKKGLDLLLAQEVTGQVSPFGQRPVKAYLASGGGSVKSLGNVSKKRVAALLVREVERLFAAK